MIGMYTVSAWIFVDHLKLWTCIDNQGPSFTVSSAI
jgi:hypothetical protein